MKETKIIAAVVYYDVESSEDCYRYIDHEFSIRVEREKRAHQDNFAHIALAITPTE